MISALTMLKVQVARAAGAAKWKGALGFPVPWEVPGAVGGELAAREVFPAVSSGLTLRKCWDSCLRATRCPH